MKKEFFTNTKVLFIIFIIISTISVLIMFLATTYQTNLDNQDAMYYKAHPIAGVSLYPSD